MGFRNIRVLATLIATAQQDNQHAPMPDVIDAIARPEPNPQFTHTVTDWFYISRISMGKTINASRYRPLGVPISKATHPFQELKGAANLDHDSA